tara:strand:+ start:331 stop:483 length:153 start_codon:yes stop_codon:yes gene_type:complete
MKTIKFLSPTHVLLDGEMLTKCKYSKIYDKTEKKYVSLSSFYKINNEIYV